MSNKRPYNYHSEYLKNGSGTRKIRRIAQAPNWLGGVRTYYDSSKYMPHVGQKQINKGYNNV